MTKENLIPTASPETIQSGGEGAESPSGNGVKRRSFLKGLGVAGAALSAGSLLATSAEASQGRGIITVGDVAILRFLAAAEILETDLWQQYNELGGIQDSEVPGGSGSPAYTRAISFLDGDMAQYIHDNTEDEMTHEVFINASLVSKGAEPVNLDAFRTLPSSQATGAAQVGRLTNLMQLTVDTSWWTRYRSRQNPDFGATFPNVIPPLRVGRHPAIPRNDAELGDPTNISAHVQAIANTAAFHFAFIEQGGSSLYATMALKVTGLEALRIVVSIGPTATSHFQTWHDKAGNAPQVTDGSLIFPDFNSPALSGEAVKKNLIMPEPCIFLRRPLPDCSIIRPTAVKDVALGAVTALT